jgi:hypothetical protein
LERAVIGCGKACSARPGGHCASSPRSTMAMAE